jgi:preprotein translocase subunit SecE
VKNIFRSKWIVVLILVPLGLFIYGIDKKLSQDFIEGPKSSDHLYIIGLLVIVVSILLTVILNIDKNSK